MEREEAIEKLNRLIGADLRILADKYKVTVWKNKKLNKGWAGHTIERCLGLPLNSSQSPNCGSWELKVVSLKMGKKNRYVAKETMSITQINSYDVTHKDFLDSHLYSKLRRIVVCSREFLSKKEESSKLLRVTTFNLDDPEILRLVSVDYEIVRDTIINHGFSALTGRMGVLVQPRTKGPGHGSTSRAFYARKAFLEYILGIRTSIET